MNYYNEIDPFAAEWLLALIAARELPMGYVDTRSIVDVKPGDLAGFTQCHFFAGIGGWSHALRLAGWNDERPVWTGSCPCQPFSVAGARAGDKDARHLWPEWYRLIRECKPSVVFGEQVENAIGHGWLDLVQVDLEAEDYAVGKGVLPAAGVGSPHGRHRLYWVADAEHTDRRAEQQEHGDTYRRNGSGRSGESGILADRGSARLAHGEPEDLRGARRQDGGYVPVARGPVNGFWHDADWVLTRPQRVGDRPGLRPIEPGTFPLATGVPARVGRLRSYGNSIVPQVAAVFIVSYMDLGR